MPANTRQITALLVGSALALGVLFGCERDAEDHLEDAGENTEDAAEDVGDATEDMVDDLDEQNRD